MTPANPEESAPQQSAQTALSGEAFGYARICDRPNQTEERITSSFAYFADKLHQIAFCFQFRTSMAAGIKFYYSETWSKQSQQTPNVRFIAVQHSGTLAANAPLSWEQFDSSLVLFDLITMLTLQIKENKRQRSSRNHPRSLRVSCLSSSINRRFPFYVFEISKPTVKKSTVSHLRQQLPSQMFILNCFIFGVMHRCARAPSRAHGEPVKAFLSHLTPES